MVHAELNGKFRRHSREYLNRQGGTSTAPDHLAQNCQSDANRQEIGAKYEFKYSALLLVLADLAKEGRINLDELHGLGEDKLRLIRDHAQ